MKNFSTQVFLLVLLAACTTPTEALRPGSEKVTVLSQVTLSDLNSMTKIGSGTCEIGVNARTQATNKEACENYLRNEAATKGADYIVFIATSRKGLTTAGSEADFYKKK